MDASALWHDAAGLDETESARLFADHGGQFGYSPEEIELVCDAILSTDEFAQPKTREEALDTMSDMNNLTHPYGVVKQRGEQFEAEARETEGDQFDAVSYRKRNLLRVARFVTKDLSILGGFELPWVRRVQATARQMIADFAAERRQALPDCVREIGEAALQLFASKSTEE